MGTALETLDILTDRMADYGVHLWHSLLYFMGYMCDNYRQCAKESLVRFEKWFEKVTDGNYDPEYEDDIIVQIWQQKFGMREE